MTSIWGIKGSLGRSWITWRIIPFSKWSITMVIVSPLSRVIPLPNGTFKWLTNHLLTGMILQVGIQDLFFDEVLVTEHFLNMLMFIVEFVLNRNIFYLKHGMIIYIYALLCLRAARSDILKKDWKNEELNSFHIAWFWRISLQKTIKKTRVSWSKYTL